MRYSLLVAALLMVGCGGSSAPAPPSVNSPGTVTIRGTEKLGWDQVAADSTELSTIGYEAYVDDGPSTLTGVICASTPTAAGFECKAPLPALTPGAHKLELSSFYLSNPDTKSARAGPLNVLLSTTVSDASIAASRTRTSESRSSDSWPAGTHAVALGLDRPADLAFTPDDRLLIAERSGRVRVVRDEILLDQPALTLTPGPAGGGAIVALSVDPAFLRTRFVYAVYTAQSRSGELAFTVARFREAGDTLADGIVLLDDVPASTDPHAALRFGLDGKLYVAFDDGGDDRLVQDLASFNGKVLRLNVDGTTPDDAPRKSPIWLEGLASPRGLGWHVRTRHLWTATATTVGAVRWPSTPNALALVRDDLFVGSDAGLVRAKLDERTPGRVVSADDVVRGMAVRALAVRSDGAVYFATVDAVGVLDP